MTSSGDEHRYEVIIWWSVEDKAFVAQVPELRGCMAHGNTKSDALAIINEAVQLWLDTAHEFAREVPAPKGHQLFA